MKTYKMTVEVQLEIAVKTDDLFPTQEEINAQLKSIHPDIELLNVIDARSTDSNSRATTQSREKIQPQELPLEKNKKVIVNSYLGDENDFSEADIKILSDFYKSCLIQVENKLSRPEKHSLSLDFSDGSGCIVTKHKFGISKKISTWFFPKKYNDGTFSIDVVIAHGAIPLEVVLTFEPTMELEGTLENLQDPVIEELLKRINY